MFIFRGVCKSFVRSNMCSCNPLRTLSVSDRSCRGAVRILISLAPRNPLGTLCWSALVSALCVGRSVSHCFLLWFPTPHTVCFLLPEQFFGMYILIILVPYMVVKFIGRKKMDRGGLPWPLCSFPLMSFRQARLFGACAAAWWECRPSTFRPCRREGVAQWLTR